MGRHVSFNDACGTVTHPRPTTGFLLPLATGDLIVRPSFAEAAVQRRATSSVANHLLVNYQRAHIAIIKAQFTSKRLANGMSVRVWGLAVLLAQAL